MKIRTLLALCSGVALGATALAQPIPDADLGALISGTPSTGTVTGIAATSRTKWVKFTISGVVRANGDFLDIDTNGGTLTPGGDSMIGLYNSTGGFLAFNDDSGAGAYSMLSFGSTTSRPGLVPTGNATAGNGAAHTGGNGATLATGTYWLAITGFGGTVFGTNNWGVTSTHARTGDVAYRLAYQYTALPSNPAGTGSFAPTSVTNCGDTTSQTLASVLVTLGTNPTSSGTVVTADLTSVGGSASQMMFDNATNGDLVAGDNRFSFLVTVPNTVTIGSKTFTFNIVDEQARTATGTSSSVTVTLCPAPPMANNSCGTAEELVVGVNEVGTTTTLGDSSTVPACGSTTSGRMNWYYFEGTGNTMTLSTCSSLTNHDTIVGAYCGAAGCGALTCIGSNDDALDNCAVLRQASILSFCTVQGARYFAVVRGFSANTGNYELSLADSGVACTTAISCGQPTNPSGVGSTNVTSVTNCGDNLITLRATVTPGTIPTSTGVSVTGNLSSIGGGGSKMFFNNGTNGDLVANDNIWSFQTLVADTTAVGAASIPFTVTDAQLRNGAGIITFNVSQCPPPPPAYDNCAGAVAVDLSGGPASIDGYVTPRSATVTLPFCTSGLGSRAAFYTVMGNGGTFTVDTSATTGTGSMTDTVVAVYCATTGCSALRCIGGDDDSGTGNYSLFSFCTQPNAQYLVVVTGFLGGTGSFNLAVADTGTACSTAIPCAPSGACCIAVEGVCVITTAAACADQGGTYLGDNVACGSTAYGEPNASADTFPISIPDFANATPGSASTTATVAGNGGTVDALSISVGLTHTFPGDLIGTLSDGTTSALLFSRQGGSNDVAGVYSFSSDGTNIFAGGAPFNPYASFDSLSAFTGSAIDATWTLTVTDNASLDVGTINSFNISFGTTTPSCSFCPICAADYDNSGGVDGADVDAFFVDWAAAAACADVDQSGGVDGADVDAFFVDWSAGGC